MAQESARQFRTRRRAIWTRGRQTVEHSPATMIQSESQGKCIATPTSPEDAEILSTTTSIAADVESFSRNRRSDRAEKHVLLASDHGKSRLLFVSFDIGDHRNHSLGTKASMLRLEPRQRSSPNQPISEQPTAGFRFSCGERAAVPRQDDFLNAYVA